MKKISNNLTKTMVYLQNKDDDPPPPSFFVVFQVCVGGYLTTVKV